MRKKSDTGDNNSKQQNADNKTALTGQKEAEKRLRQSEENFRAYIKATSHGIWTIGESEQDAEAEHWWTNLTGRVTEHLHNWTSDLHPEDRERVENAWRKAQNEKSLFDVVYRIKSKCGEYRHYAVRGVPVFNENGSFRQWIGTFNDITERKRYESNLKFLAEISVEFVKIGTTAEIMQRAGEKIKQHFGFSELVFAEINEDENEASIVYDSSAAEIVYSNGRQQELSEFLTAEHLEQLKTGQIVVYNNVTAAGDADLQPEKIRSRVKIPFINGGWKLLLSGERYGISGWENDEIKILQELAARIYLRIDRDLAERRIRRSEQNLHDLINNLFSFVGLLEPDGTLIEINQTALASANLKSADVLGKKLGNSYWWFWSNELQKKLRRAIRRAAAGETLRFDLITRIGDDQFITIDFQLAPIFDENGQVIRLVSSGIDITERLQLEAKLRQTERVSLAGEIAVSLAHEIKNPLTGIQGAIDILLRHRKLKESDRHILESVRREVVRIDETVRSLLDSSYPRAINPELASLAETVRRAVQIVKYEVIRRRLKNKVAIVFQASNKDLFLPHDAAQIEDAVLNLILNAVDAVEERGGDVSIHLYEALSHFGKNEVVIAVSDSGGGISETNLQNLFTPFYTTKDYGTGLGLVAVKRIAAAHGGRCTVKSDLGKGSIFSLHLPMDLPY